MGVPFIHPEVLARIVPPVAPGWEHSPEAMALLAKVDAYERAADAWEGRCDDAAKAFSDAAGDVECDLHNLRDDAAHDFADATGPRQASAVWANAFQEADETLTTVEEAIKWARILHLGDDILGSAR